MKKKQPHVQYFRARKQRSGKIYYYLEVPHSTPRKEICLGSDFKEALSKRDAILFESLLKGASEPLSVLSVLHLFQQIMVPTLEAKVQQENLRSIEKLEQFFKERGNIKFAEIGSTTLADDYISWRGSRMTLSAKSEVALLKRATAKVLALEVLPTEQSDC